VPAFTQETFDSTSWVDNFVHGFHFVEKPEGGGELHFDIDHILEWLDGDANSFKFRVAPARLRFVGVNNLRVQIDYRAALMGPFQMDGIDRRKELRTQGEVVIWTIGATNPDVEIEFEASGYVQDLTGPPLLLDRQWLLPGERGDV
jgi:hypothetical protein